MRLTKNILLIAPLNMTSTSALLSSSARTVGSQSRGAGASTLVGSTRDALSETDAKGEFKRTDAAWRNWISKGT